jgi:hypothetical protein
MANAEQPQNQQEEDANIASQIVETLTAGNIKEKGGGSRFEQVRQVGSPPPILPL